MRKMIYERSEAFLVAFSPGFCHSFAYSEQISSREQKGPLMADQLLIEQLQQGVPAWNTWKAKHPTSSTQLFDLSGVDFTSMNVHLHGIDLTCCLHGTGRVDGRSILDTRASDAFHYIVLQ